MILVTGSTGQVGSHVVDALRAAGGPVTGLDLRASAWTEHVADVRSLGSGTAVRATAVVHCAAQVSVARSIEDPRHDAAHNLDGTLAVLDWARRRDVERVVLLSSAAVYGDPDTVPVREDHPTRPLSPYGLSKVASEQYAALYHRLHGVPTVVLRPFNIFSARQDGSNPYSGVISLFARAAARNEPLRIHGDGKQTRDFVHVSDVVAAVRIVLSSRNAVGGTFNVGTGRATTILDLAKTVIALAGSRSQVALAPARAGDIRHSVADVGRLAALGYAPKTDLQVHLRELLAPAVTKGT